MIKKSKLNAEQMKVANNRLQTIFNTITARITNPSYLNVVNFDDAEEVAAFIKKLKLPASPPSWGQHLKTWFITGGRVGGETTYNTIYTALNNKSAALITATKSKMGPLQEKLLFAQDKIIFGEITPEEVPEFLKTFESEIKSLATV